MGKGSKSLSHSCLTVPVPIHHFLTYRHRMAKLLPDYWAEWGLGHQGAARPARRSLPPSFHTKVYIIGYPCDETGTRLDNAKHAFIRCQGGPREELPQFASVHATTQFVFR